MVFHGWLKKPVEVGRYGLSEAMRNKNLQKKAVNYGINKMPPILQKTIGNTLDKLSTQVGPNKKYKTDRKDLDRRKGRGIDIHNAILKVASKKGFVLPRHNYTGSGNPLDSQLK